MSTRNYSEIFPSYLIFFLSQFNSKESHTGIFAGPISSYFAFIPANVIASREEYEGWAEQGATLEEASALFKEVFKNTHPDVLRGIRKGYDVIKTWLVDPKQPV